MLNITGAQKRLLLEYLPNARQLIEVDGINDVLLALDAKITEIGFDVDYELNAVGRKLQRLYNEIYEQN